MKKAILVISFGTSYPETRKKTIEACEQQLAEAYPDRDFFRAFTSRMIMAKLAKRDGELIDNPEQALTRLRDLGYDDVAIQSLHVLNGDEYEKITSQVDAFRPDFKRLVIGKPLITHYNDYETVIDALQQQAPEIAEDERIVFMGHGATHHAFAVYACLDHILTHKKIPMIIGAVESYPEIDVVIERLKQERVRKVHLMPLMIVAGDHAINDMASAEEDSWNTLIQQAGIETQCWLQGLGENTLIQQMFVDHLAQAINDSEEGVA